mmetsp:Transcript_55101/g.87374  ORF Transcript_55101/g.87374 Transcript_55101/m.87374 type:complete len:157 (+) Transcript_55101:115-585(+)
MFAREEFVENPVHNAACKANADELMQLLREGHDANVPNFRGTPPLHIAVEHNSLDAVRTLLEFKADVNGVHQARGTTAAHVAVGSGSADILRVLVQAGADLDARNTWGDSVTKVARKQLKAGKTGSDEVWSVLVDFGVVAAVGAVAPVTSASTMSL